MDFLRKYKGIPLYFLRKSMKNQRFWGNLFWSRKNENFRFHPKQNLLVSARSMKYLDFNFCWNRASATPFTRAIRSVVKWSKMSPNQGFYDKLQWGRSHDGYCCDITRHVDL